MPRGLPRKAAGEGLFAAAEGHVAAPQPPVRIARGGRGEPASAAGRCQLPPGGCRRGEAMEVAGERPAAAGSGPLTSTAKEAAAPDPPPPRPPGRNSSTSSFLSNESSEEDWLIKVCCPGARHRYCRNAQYIRPAKIEFQQNSDKDESTGGTSSSSCQSYPRVLRKESSQLDWLIRLRCPGALMEHQVSDRKHSLPATSTPSQARRNSQSRREKPVESWLTQKHLSALQAVVSGHACVGSSPQALLERENYLMREVDSYLKHSDFLALRRKEMQYKKWFENVSKPLLQKIQDKVDSQSSEEIEERKRKQLSLYLDYCNKQHGAYLESYNPSDYDPFFLKSTDIWKVSMPPLCDPLLRDVQERYLEEEIIQQCDTGGMYSSTEPSELRKSDLPHLPLSRQVMNPIEWLKIPASYVESEIRQQSRRKVSNARNRSSMDFRSWGDQTWPLPSKRFPSARKPDSTSASNLLAKQRLGTSPSWKPVIKFAS